MSIGIFLSIASFALSLGGLVPIFFLDKEQKKILILLTVIFSTLFITTGIVLFRGLQHEKLIRTVQFEIRESLGAEAKILDQLYQELPLNREYSVVVEALFREVDKGNLGQKTIYFNRDAESIPVKTYFVKH